ncbi:hypothetical protein SAMN02927921_00365 [Sinomicrobium oceani]|uniref:VOC domain-containing protein n=1 Tax=Sinomicrobium oceani TaxID=1150368 RepID=A0A1K1M446_9FLAO|nr:VOC family protein [Sinomicrobium oceani]SFW17899.1 hypothetical protein SAMN02927921_00365 [Sinomicrobium oceani]
MKIEDYDNFFLGATDLEKSKFFYRDTLGLDLKFDFSNMGMTAFKVGENEPAIILKDLTKFPTAKPAIWFKVASVQATYEELNNKGVEFLTAPYKISTGWAVEFKDPAGNVLGFTDYDM